MKTYILSAPNQLHGEDGSFWELMQHGAPHCGEVADVHIAGR